MIKEAMEYIEKLSAGKIREIDGRQYSTKDLYPVRIPDPNAIQCSSLSAIAEYLNEDIDGISGYDPVIHIQTENIVSLYSSLIPPWNRRFLFMTAVNTPKGKFIPERWYEPQELIPRLQSEFVETHELMQLIKFLSSISSGAVTESDDDGITQVVTVKKGIHKKDNAHVQPHWYLNPFRTFIEIDQPGSRYLLRTRGAGDMPEIALFEADGGGWKREAMKLIKEYFTGQLDIGEVTVIV
jgi:hypothetical protein